MANRKKNTVLVAFALLVCCVEPATGPDSPTRSKTEAGQDLLEVMTELIEPAVDQMLPGELTKDPEAVDFAKIQKTAQRIKAVFEAIQNPSHPFFQADDAKIPAKARKAVAWFTEIAAAANKREHAKLVDLYKRKRAICSQCHMLDG